MEHEFTAVAQALYNPLNVRDGLTIKDYVPQDVKLFLNEHWWSFPPLTPLYYYIFGILYLVGGILNFIYLTSNTFDSTQNQM